MNDYLVIYEATSQEMLKAGFSSVKSSDVMTAKSAKEAHSKMETKAKKAIKKQGLTTADFIVAILDIKKLDS